MSRVYHPSRWEPNCWAIFAVSLAAVVAVAIVYSVGAP